MRHIDFDEIELPNGWSTAASEAAAEVAVVAPTQRSVEIDKRAKVWHALKDALAEVSYDKCWYCETSQIRSDNNVDHFRPKNSVVERKADHSGYWWLAFDFENYRYSCTFCNSRRKDVTTGLAGGKHDHFPIRDETRRACSPTDDLDLEEPLLLDPIVGGDPGHLWFEPDGRVVSRFADTVSPLAHARATISIRLLHLDHYQLKRRRSKLYKKIARLVKAGTKFWDGVLSGDAQRRQGFDMVMKELISLSKPDAEYSSAARAYISGFKNKPWIEAVLQVS